MTGGSVSTGKGTVDLSDATTWGEDIATKYGSYGAHLNSFRLKNAQDVIALKVADNTKLIFFEHCNSKAGTSFRCPKIATNEDLTEGIVNDAPTADDNPDGTSIVKYEVTIANAGTYYIGSYNGDTYFSYLIVEADEPDGTPSITIGDQQYDESAKAYYREVTCTPDTDVEGMSTVVTYTTDGTTPTAESNYYYEPIKVYGDQMLKFQAYLDAMGDGTLDEAFIIEGAENEASVTLSFDAPTISNDGASVTLSSAYDGLVPVTYYYTLNDGEATQGSAVTLTESATVAAYMVINNNGNEYTSATSSSDIYLLDPITEEKVLTVGGGDVVYDEETAAYTVENGTITADSNYFFIKNATFAAVTDEQYQINGQNVYIQMSNTNITFMITDSAHVKVVTSLNSCKSIAADGDHKNYVNVGGTTYGNDDVTAENGNIIEFDLSAGTYTFQKYSGTGNILIYSITITPSATTGVSAVAAEETATTGVIKVVKDGQIVIEKGGKQYNAVGAQIK